jgi:hypothetical protein
VAGGIAEQIQALVEVGWLGAMCTFLPGVGLDGLHTILHMDELWSRSNESHVNMCLIALGDSRQGGCPRSRAIACRRSCVAVQAGVDDDERGIS